MDDADLFLLYIDAMKILHSHKLQNGPRWIWESWHNQWSGYHLWLILDGQGELAMKTREFQIKPGVCFVLPMEERFSATQDPLDPLCIMGVHFDDPAPAALPPVYNIVPDSVFFPKLIDRCIEEHHVGHPSHACIWLQAALCELNEMQAHPHTPGQEIHPHDIETIVETMRQDPGKRLSLEAMARAVPCSRDHLIRLFKKYYGCTPIEYQLQLRMNAARNLLVFSNQSVTHIAEQLGYNDPFSFSAQFKKRHDGLSPLQYRKNLRRQ